MIEASDPYIHRLDVDEFFYRETGFDPDKPNDPVLEPVVTKSIGGIAYRISAAQEGKETRVRYEAPDDAPL